MTALDGAAFALDAPTGVDAVWGEGSRVLWAKGEPAMIVKPDGVGGTTIAQQLILARAGIKVPALLGLPVASDLDRRVLYLALDRPQQAARSMRRMVTDADRQALEAGLTVWKGELPFDLVSDPHRLLAFAQEHDAGTIVIDSLKDVADKLSDEAVASAINKAMQMCVHAGVEVLPLHHQRKAQGNNKKPRTLADVYGNRWLFAGCGSIVMLWGEAGDPIVELTHLKQPADVVGPLTLLHENTTGTTSVAHAADVVELLATATAPLTVKEVAVGLFKVREPKENDLAKARRRLKAAEAEGHTEQLETADGEAALWTTTAKAKGGLTLGVDGGLTQGVGGEGVARPLRSRAATTPVDAEGDGSWRRPVAVPTAAVDAGGVSSNEGQHEELSRRVRAIARMTDEQAQERAWAELAASYDPTEGVFDYDGATDHHEATT
jgi:replicative DNA helicase